jgi:preprotein translocase subunit SecA
MTPLRWLKKLARRDEVATLKPLVRAVAEREPELRKLTDGELREHYQRLRERGAGERDLERVLPEVFALVREAGRRTLGERIFDEQVMGGIVLARGSIAEMKTGEGKTLAATMPVCLRALAGKGVHVVTVNEYLARRDAQWMGPIYKLLGLTVGCILHGQETNEKKRAYLADVTYGTNNEFGFDYLRDHMVYDKADRVQRELHYAIVDEVDSILIDEARTPLIISVPDEESTRRYVEFSRLVRHLREGRDYNIDEKRKTVQLTDEGIAHVEKLLGVKNIYTERGIRTVHHLEQALRAHACYHRDRDYVVKEGQVIIVDNFTGRLMPGRRFAEGLHQALEAKEGVPVQQESRTLATITFQNFFRLYEHLAGMTGTAKTSEEEFQKVYALSVAVIPTHKPMIREDLPDRIYLTEEAKFRAVVEEIKKRHARGQPVLVGTISIEKSEYLSRLLQAAGIEHEVLNAKHHEREAKIIARAGQRGAVTISTNMAGRGTDIKLGRGAAELGGLHVIGTERHEARRIDNQLRGRAGRQGDPGSSQFFVSLDDDLMRIFASNRVKNMLRALKLPEDQPIEHRMVSRAIEAAQARVEGYYFDVRRHVLQYDDVLNRQRDAFYAQREKFLGKSEEVIAALHEILERFVELLLRSHAAVHPHEWNLAEIAETIAAVVPESNLREEELAACGELSAPEAVNCLRKKLRGVLRRAVAARLRKMSAETFAAAVRFVALRTLDMLWTEHLDVMEYLRTGVGLRGYGQRDPLVEYRMESRRLFERFRYSAAEMITRTVFHVQVARPEERQDPFAGAQVTGGEEVLTTSGLQPAAATPVGQAQAASAQHLAAKAAAAKVGRNDPCPCGSGKKYKKCHGR